MLQVVYPVGIDNTPKLNDTILKCLIIEERHVGRFDNMRVFAKVVQSGSLAGAAASCYWCFDSVPGAELLPDRGIKSAPRRTNMSSVHSDASATGGSYHRGTLRSSVPGS